MLSIYWCSRQTEEVEEEEEGKKSEKAKGKEGKSRVYFITRRERG